ncbi:outer membrane protein [Labrys neptuniae]
MRLRCFAAAASMLATTAFAADLAPAPVEPAAPTVVPFSWTGFYLGVNAGVDFAHDKFTMSPYGLWSTAGDSSSSPFIREKGSPTLSPVGFTGGVQAGYNWQQGQIVYGIEADFSGTDLSKQRLIGPVRTNFNVPMDFKEKMKSDWLTTARARIGWALDRILLYATGGVAVADYSYSSGYVYGTNNPNFAGGLISYGSKSRTLVGWTIGAGAEYALTNHWTVKAEYLFVDLGNAPSIRTAESGGVPGPTTYSIKSKSHLTENVLRLGVNYKF